MLERYLQGVAERVEQVGAATLLEGDDGLAAGAGVAAEGEHGHARVQPGRDQVRFVGLHGQLLRAGRAPRGRGGAAAAALQGQDEIEHAVSVSPASDTPAPLPAE